MTGKYVVLAVKILLMASLSSRQATGFLFPDLIVLRAGSHVQSRYKIAVLQEEPFLFVNGTGYVPELLSLVGDWYAATTDDKDTFPYDIIPVNTWSQLMTRASTAHWQVSYGLVASSLLRTEDKWKSMHASIATVQTGLKMVTSKKTNKTTHALTTAFTTTATVRGKSSRTRPPPPVESSGTDLKGATMVTLDGSPQEKLLKKSPTYQQSHLKTVQTNEEGLSYVRHHPNAFVIRDSAAARHHEQQHASELVTVCPKKSLIAGAQLYYAFFGRDQAMIHFLNGALKKLRTAEYDAIRALNVKYFGHIRTCP